MEDFGVVPDHNPGSLYCSGPIWDTKPLRTGWSIWWNKMFQIYISVTWKCNNNPINNVKCNARKYFIIVWIWRFKQQLRTLESECLWWYGTVYSHQSQRSGKTTGNCLCHVSDQCCDTLARSRAGTSQSFVKKFQWFFFPFHLPCKLRKKRFIAHAFVCHVVQLN